MKPGTKISAQGLVWSFLSLLALGAACGDGETDKADASLVPDAGDTQDPTLATVASGRLRGDVTGGAVRFLKIPYAKPPVGDLRFAAPEANEPWKGERHETEFSEACAQSASQQSPATANEDCLYLNVWRPNTATKDAPVMVWIHGGANRSGSAADVVPTTKQLWYDGQVFAERHGIVVVTLNYRLGPLGFFSHPALADHGLAPGNQALLDQRFSLLWVRDNIKAFGGDPDNVTLFGESAGSASVCLHVVSPKSRGLFHRAISESGGCTGRPRVDTATAETQLSQYLSDLGCKGSDPIPCLQAASVDDLITAAKQVDLTMLGDTSSSINFGPTVDGKGGFLPMTADEAFMKGDVAKVPYILGSNTEEGALFFLGQTDFPSDDASYLAELQSRYGDFADRIAAAYPASDFGGSYEAALKRLFGDSFLVCGTADTAAKAVDAGLPVYMYNFNIPWSISRDAFGATHASEISHVFGLPYNETPDNEDVAVAMNAYWAQFALNGDPNGDNDPVVWPKYKPTAADGGRRIQFDPDWKILSSFRKAECELWAEYRAQL